MNIAPRQLVMRRHRHRRHCKTSLAGMSMEALKALEAEMEAEERREAEECALAFKILRVQLIAWLLMLTLAIGGANVLTDGKTNGNAVIVAIGIVMCCAGTLGLIAAPIMCDRIVRKMRKRG